MNFYLFDLETFNNCFLFTGKFEDDPKIQTFEMSSRKNQRGELLSWLNYLQNANCFMTGYNNLGFDYPLLHQLLNEPYTFTCETAYLKAQEIIQSKGYGFSTLGLRDRIIPQVDLMKINHFDNITKRTPLKSIQFAMRSESVEDLPFDPLIPLTSEQMDELIKYNIHDVTETEAFLKKCKHHILMRKELLDDGLLTGDVLNFSDVKIGEEVLIKKLGRAKCFIGNKPRQTIRESIEFKDIVLDKIYYRTEPFQAVLDWFKGIKIYPKSEQELPKLKANLGGLDFYFGVGGVHASVEKKYFESDKDYVIKDVDVASMYPSVSDVNEFYPEHLGKEFVVAYRQLRIDRNQYKKGSSRNLVYKLANNGVFGKSDNEFSCMYDPRYPKQITVNGQLQLLQLAEMFSLIPGVKLIQANTDGITALVPRKNLAFFDLWKKEWEIMTGLTLEEFEGRKMWIADVNNYVMLDMKGNIKLKGKYWYPKGPEDYWGSSGSNWNKDFSNMVVQKVAEQMLVNDWNPEVLIKLMTDPFDFMLRYKTPAGAKVFIGDKVQPKTVRYYISTSGEPMRKVASPKGPAGTYKRKNSLENEFYNKIMAEIPQGSWDARIHTGNKSKYEQVVTSIESGHLVKQCNHIKDFDWRNVDYKYYLAEIIHRG